MSSSDVPRFEIPTHVLHREVEGQMVLLDLETEQYFGLDDVGADIVTRITEKPVAVALDELTAAYDVDREALRTDVDDLVASLLGAGLLRRLEGEG